MATKKWFPHWLRRYAAGETLLHGILPVMESSVIEFSKSLWQLGAPAWQRLQGVRAVEAYRNLVLQTAELSLSDIKRALDRRAAFEKESNATIGAAPDKQDVARLVGQINRDEPLVIQGSEFGWRWMLHHGRAVARS